MSIRRSLTTLCLATAVSLALAANALGATAGDEYVPFVPGAAGKEVVRNGEKGSPGSSILSPEVRGSKSDSKSGDGSDSGNENGVAGAASSGGGDSGAGGTLTDPVALLVIFGIGAATLAMTLRRRQSPEAEVAGPAGRDPGSHPPPPDGEIVGGEQP
jgi:hypothetical protein